jgi:hypothetical protein
MDLENHHSRRGGGPGLADLGICVPEWPKFFSESDTLLAPKLPGAAEESGNPVNAFILD